MAYPQNTFVHTTFDAESFHGRKREVVFANTLKYQLQVLKETGRYDAFKLKWNPSYNDTPNHWPVPNHLFWDSDVAKWIEGACYFLAQRDDAEIDGAVKELVQMIQSAQQSDGYLNIHFTVVEPEKRFSNLRDLHELYNAGHLIEAALAHRLVYKNDDLLTPLVKYVDLFFDTFGPLPKKPGYPGHPEIELALLRLHNVTGNPRHLELAKFFITERGNPKGIEGRHYYEHEAQQRGEREHERPEYYPTWKAYWYQQAHKPIAEQDTIEGHSVRSMYLLTSVADLVRIDSSTESDKLKGAVWRLWRNMLGKKMYITGGIGSIKQWEGFGIDYFLPQGTDEGGCYAETCASIGIMMLAERLLQLELSAEVADVMELCFYNIVMGGMSCDGQQFTYDNQLASTNEHPCKRNEWFTCACCPPNVTRLLGYLGGYFWNVKQRESQNHMTLNVHMYGSATLEVPAAGGRKVKVRQQSGWPWSGNIEFSVQVPEDISLDVNLRIPQYLQPDQWEFAPQSSSKLSVENGYLRIPADYVRSNPSFSLKLAIEKPRYVRPHPFTNQNTISIARGPIIYCLEDVDNPWVEHHFKTTVLSPDMPTESKEVVDSKTGEKYVAITASCKGYSSQLEMNETGEPWSLESAVVESRKFTELNFVPYYFRANRGGRGQMRVGIRRS